MRAILATPELCPKLNHPSAVTATSAEISDLRVLGRVKLSPLLNSALDDAAAFAVAPAYQKRRAVRRGVAHA